MSSYITALTHGCVDLELFGWHWYRIFPDYLTNDGFPGKVVSIEEETSLAVLREDNSGGKCSQTHGWKYYHVDNKSAKLSTV